MDAPSQVQTIRGLSVGQLVFGRFLLEKLIGQGGMGLVFSAQDQVLRQRVALKFLPEHIHFDGAAREALRKETLRSRALSHKNIVRIHDFLEDENYAAIIMELVEGANLTDKRMGMPSLVFNYTDIQPWIGDLCAALAYAHQEAKIIHRDIKPANLLLSDKGEIKVTDFGVSRQVADSMSRVSSFLGGTLLYMSPGQAMGNPPTIHDDIYSLGATLYELFSGQPPFHTGDVRLQLLRRKIEPLSVRLRANGHDRAALPRRWEDTIMACLEREESRRPASVDEIARCLDAGSGSASKLRRVRPSVFPRIALSALGVCVLVCAGLWFTGHRPGFLSPKTPAAVARSDASRALGAWNLDGDGVDSSGNGLDAFSKGNTSALRTVPEPTRDRFGRLDRALHFTGGSGLIVKDTPLLNLGGQDPVALSFWIRPSNGAQTVYSRLVSITYGTGQVHYAMSVDFSDRHISYDWYTSDYRRTRLISTTSLIDSAWTHVLAFKDGQRIGIFVNGQAAGELSSDLLSKTNMFKSTLVEIGGGIAFSENHYVGDIDDLRIFRRVLSQEDILRLSSPEPIPRFRRTKGTYNDANDYAAVVQEEFGSEVRPADWEDFVRYHSDDVLALCEQIGLVKIGMQSCRVVWLGEKHWEGKRTFSINRQDHLLPAGFEAHAELGANTLVLGSWYDSRDSIIAKLPFAKPVSTFLIPDSAGVVSSSLDASPLRDAVGVTFQASLGNKTGDKLLIELRLRDGRTFMATCWRGLSGELIVSLGTQQRPEHTTTIQQVISEPMELSLVMRDGRLAFRSKLVLGEQPVFRELLKLDSFFCGEISEIRITGASGQVELVQE